MPLIETIDLKKNYTWGKDITTAALAGVSLSVERGEFLAIAGPSGSGKSTLLNLLGALDSPTSGTIIYDGHDLTAIDIRRLATFRLHNIGFVFQAYNLINTLTAVENVEYVMLLQGREPHTRRAQALSVLERVGLKDYAHRFPTEMSGGQQQRVAVARALAAAPVVIMADEPTANLDSATAAALIKLMQELNREEGITFIFSTHDRMIMDQAKRIITLRDGKIQP